MTAGWTAYANTKLQSIAPPNNYGGWGYNFPSSVDGVLNAWGAGTLDTKRNRLIFWGGGHGDYSGNELYALYLDPVPNLSDCLVSIGGRFGRITNPGGIPFGGTGYVEISGAEVLADGTPNSRHTYGGVVYVPHLDKIWAYGGSLAKGSGGMSTWVWTFDCATKTWSHRSPTGTSPNYGSMPVIHAQYDPATHLIYVKTGTGFHSYNVDTDVWTELKHNDTTLALTNGMCVLDPVRRRMLCFQQTSANVYYVDLTGAGGYAAQLLTTVGTNNLVGGRSPGVAYCNANGLIVGWYGASDRTALQESSVSTLDQSTSPATWTTYGPFTGFPSSGGAGIYGRWQFIPSLNAFVVCTAYNDNCYAFQLADSLMKATIATNTWVARSIAGKSAAMPNGGKHQKWVHNPVDGKIYMCGGDHGDPVGYPTGAVASGRKDMTRYHILTDTWEHIQDYCSAPGVPLPGHPDQAPFTYDSLRNKFWLIPGYIHELYPCVCGGADEVYDTIMTYEPLVAASWLSPSVPGAVAGGVKTSAHDFAAYDPITDSLLIFKQQTGGAGYPQVKVYNIGLDTVTNYTFSGFGTTYQIFNASQPAIDIPGRVVYIIGLDRWLYKYNIDSHTLVRLSQLPVACPPTGQEDIAVWNSASQVFHYLAKEATSLGIVHMFTYNPGLNVWYQDPMYQPNGLTVSGRVVVYDSYQDIFITEPYNGNGYIYLYRYSATVTPPPPEPPPPIIPPPVPTPPTNLTFTSAKIFLQVLLLGYLIGGSAPPISVSASPRTVALHSSIAKEVELNGNFYW